jgi:hypothetical protein
MPPHGDEVTLALLNQKLDTLSVDVKGLQKDFDSHYQLRREFDIYKPEIEGRLRQGNDRMAQIEKDAAVEHANCQNAIAAIRAEYLAFMKDLPVYYVEKKVLFAYLAGVASVAGGIGGTVGWVLKGLGH